MSNELVILDQKINPLVIFGGITEDGKNPLEELIKGFEKHSRSILTDVTTPKGRKEIASLAHQIARTKTTLDKMGKDLNEEKRKSINAVNSDRNFATERLQALQDEIRKPLTDFENKEKERIAEHEQIIELILEYKSEYDIQTSEDAEKYLAQAKALYDREWEEFSDKAKSVFGDIEKYLIDLSNQILKHEAEAAELEKFRKEKEERETKEREESIAREAAETARLEAEAKAKEEADIAEAAAKAEREAIEQKAKAEREAAETKRLEIERKNKEERDQADRLQKEAEDRIQAAEKATKEAAEKERKRIVDEQKAEQIAAEKREKDKKHKASINNAALAAFKEAGLSLDNSKKAVEAIAKRLIPNVMISY